MQYHARCYSPDHDMHGVSALVSPELATRRNNDTFGDEVGLRMSPMTTAANYPPSYLCHQIRRRTLARDTCPR